MVYCQCFKPCWLPQPIDCSSGYFFLFKMDGEPAAVAEAYRADMQDWTNFVSHSNVLLLYMRDTLLRHICMQNVFFYVFFPKQCGHTEGVLTVRVKRGPCRSR